MVGVTIEVAASTAAAVQVGDRIDVLAANGPAATVVAKAATVLAIRAGPTDADARAVFVAIPPDAAARIAAIPADARITLAVLSR
jgi:hypothetical protein